MDKEFHYNIVYIISRAIGLSNDESYKIAYSSQFVDDNNTVYEIKQNNDDSFINEVSQSFDISKPAKELEEIYIALHFLPTLEYVENRKDRLCSRLVTTPNNKISQIMLQKACESYNPYLIGITLHAYADTWAHQNFTGKFEKFNCSPKYSVLEASLGHMEYIDNPDRVGNIWEDERLIESKINNNERFLNALEHIYNALSIHLRTKPIIPLVDLVEQIKGIWSHSKQKRDEEYERLLIKISGDNNYIAYDKNCWLAAAAIKQCPQYQAVPGFLESNWCGFQKALIEYKEMFKQVLNKENKGF